jgi:MFS family permease
MASQESDRFSSRLYTLDSDVIVLSFGMFAFSLGFQMTNRYVPEYMAVLGAGSIAIGALGTLGNFLGAVYPYPGGMISSRIGARRALTIFGLLSTGGFLIWFFAPYLGSLSLLPGWGWILIGLCFAQAWRSLARGPMFTVVKESMGLSTLATGFATAETFRRFAFLSGPLIAAGVLAFTTDFLNGFQTVILVAIVTGLVATVIQHTQYRPAADTLRATEFSLQQFLMDVQTLPSTIRPLLIGDILVRFANGMVYVFFVIVVTRVLGVDVTALGVYLSPEAFFGVLLAIEMGVALLVMYPAARLADQSGLKWVIAGGFLVYAIFPILLITAPSRPGTIALLFAFSGLRYAGYPAHQALIVGPAIEGVGDRVTGTYYTLRNTVIIPSTLISGILFSISPLLAFGLATGIGLLGTGYFFVFGNGLDIR